METLLGIFVLLLFAAIFNGVSFENFSKFIKAIIKLCIWVFGLIIAPIFLWIIQTTESTKYSFWFYLFFTIVVISYKKLFTIIKKHKGVDK